MKLVRTVKGRSGRCRPTRGIALCIVLFLLPTLARTQAKAPLQGWVSDIATGEPLAGVAVDIAGWPLRTTTDNRGYFRIADLVEGEYTIQFSAVGYHPAKKSFALPAPMGTEFEIVLVPVVFHKRESITVNSSPSGPIHSAGFAELTVSLTEAQELSTTLVSDPLRVVQRLPGAASNNDFESRFSVQGADFHRVGVYLDGVLLRNPFHTVPGVSGVSLAVFDSALFDTVSLDTGPPAVNISDRTAGILQLRTREGSRRRFAIKGSASLTNSTFSLEGPLGRNQRGSWLASVRKGFPGYLFQQASKRSGIDAGFTDFQGKLHYDLSSRQQLSLILMNDSSNLHSAGDARDDFETLLAGDFRFQMVHLAWSYSPSERMMITNRGAFFREQGSSLYMDGLAQSRDVYSEWAWSADGTRVWAGANTLRFGVTLRRMRDEGFYPLVDLRTSSPLSNWLHSVLPSNFVNLFRFDASGMQEQNNFQGSLLQGGGYLQQSWSAANHRILLTAGLRWDRQSVSGTDTVSPQASLAFAPDASTRVHLSWGRSSQFPNPQELFSALGSNSLLPERADHLEAGFDHDVHRGIRLRIGSYIRWDRDLLFRPYSEPRILDGRVFSPSLTAPIRNSVRGRSQGIQFLLEKRSASGLNGWISYALGTAEMQDREAGIRFPSDWDQRHTVSAVANYRIRPSVLLSGKWVHGSGMPIPGFYRRDAGQTFLSEDRNALRLGSYRRLDLRVDKQFSVDRWSLTLYGEIINALNHHNPAVHQYNQFNPSTGAVRFSSFHQFPILPSGGLRLEF